MQRKTYRTRRLIVRPFTSRDFRVWRASFDAAKPAVDKHDISPWPLKRRTKAAFKAIVQRQLKNAKAGKVYVWHVFLKNTGEYIGRLDIATVVREPHQMANLGYYVINTYRGKGYAFEALACIVRAGLKDLRFHRLEAVIDLDNRKSIKLAKKVGLYREGIKKHYWYQNKRWEDQVVFIATPELYPV